MSRSVDLLGPKSDAVRGAQLLLQGKNRRARGQFLVEGPQAVQAALAAGWVEQLYLTPELQDEYASLHSGRTYLVSDAGLKSIAETENPAGVIAVARIPDIDLSDISGDCKVLVAAEISDPGNLGTIIRTAAAAGYDFVITTAGSVDAWSGKVVRSTAGMFTGVGVLSSISTDLVFEILKNQQIPAIATTAQASLNVTDSAARELLQRPHFLFIGNEAHGLSDEVLQQAIGIKIPMADGVESLNAAVAAAICMYAHKF